MNADVFVEDCLERFTGAKSEYRKPKDGGDYNTLEWFFTSKPHLFGLMPGLAIPTGFILILVLTVMWAGSLNCVRRSGHFEVFYFTHLLYYVYFVALIFHAPSCYEWMVAPLALLVIELIYRFAATCTGFLGHTVITQGLVLPSKTTGLVIKKPANFRHTPGDWVFVKIPAIAGAEWHPFTISSAPEEKVSRIFTSSPSSLIRTDFLLGTFYPAYSRRRELDDQIVRIFRS